VIEGKFNGKGDWLKLAATNSGAMIKSRRDAGATQLNRGGGAAEQFLVN
jgi:hypothetical protein